MRLREVETKTLFLRLQNYNAETRFSFSIYAAVGVVSLGRKMFRICTISTFDLLFYCIDGIHYILWQHPVNRVASTSHYISACRCHSGHDERWASYNVQLSHMPANVVKKSECIIHLLTSVRLTYLQGI